MITPVKAFSSDPKFAAKIVERGECWEYSGMRDKASYGRVKRRGRTIPAHRYAYIICHGSIPHGLYICHHCDNPPCVRPAHLFAGTHADNMHDKISKGRGRCGFAQQPHCLGCGRTLPVEAFHKEPRVKSGRASRCIECVNGTRRQRIAGSLAHE